MSWLGLETLWIFYSGSSEINHIRDIQYAVGCLSRAGVNLNQIVVFVLANIIPNFDSLKIKTVFDVCDFEVNFVKKNLSSTHVFFTATGHGHMRGLDFILSTGQHAFVAPSQLMSIVRAIRGIEFGIVLLGQCMAGIFNFVEAKKTNEAELCIIGATNIESSLNFWIDARYKDMHLNFFLANFFDWSRNTKLTLMGIVKPGLSMPLGLQQRAL